MNKVDKIDNVTMASEADAGDADALRLQISHVLDVGGGARIGPKAITVMAPLFYGSKVVVRPRSTAGRSAPRGAASRGRARSWNAAPPPLAKT
ncbi:hypothetical protein [Ralstonia sp. UBA689]|uniref:hypothetical protein n=1 Tax=Ralstonia sp. UBA689 TaxID=1947373 RepID=UPI0025D63399|nr:hypothetical protein [Ralstonia sp. UBA689]